MRPIYRQAYLVNGWRVRLFLPRFDRCDFFESLCFVIFFFSLPASLIKIFIPNNAAGRLLRHPLLPSGNSFDLTSLKYTSHQIPRMIIAWRWPLLYILLNFVAWYWWVLTKNYYTFQWHWIEYLKLNAIAHGGGSKFRPLFAVHLKLRSGVHIIS